MFRQCVCSEPADQFCGKCLSTYYCSRACQIADWKSHHPQCKDIVFARAAVASLQKKIVGTAMIVYVEACEQAKKVSHIECTYADSAKALTTDECLGLVTVRAVCDNSSANAAQNTTHTFDVIHVFAENTMPIPIHCTMTQSQYDSLIGMSCPAVLAIR